LPHYSTLSNFLQDHANNPQLAVHFFWFDWDCAQFKVRSLEQAMHPSFLITFSLFPLLATTTYNACDQESDCNNLWNNFVVYQGKNYAIA